MRKCQKLCVIKSILLQYSSSRIEYDRIEATKLIYLCSDFQLIVTFPLDLRSFLVRFNNLKFYGK